MSSGGSDSERQACPECGTEMERYVPAAWNCPECDRDYWKEGDSWWSCDVSGEPVRVEVAADGGASSWERTYVCPDCEREARLSGEMDEDRAIVVIGCSDGHKSRDMVRKSRYQDTGSDQEASDDES